MSELEAYQQIPAYDLESDQPPAFAEPDKPAAPAPEPAPAPQAAEPAAPPADPDEPAETIEVQGGKYAPLTALKGAREEAKALKQQNQQLLEAYQQAQGWAPYVNFLQQHPEIMTGRMTPPAAPEPPKDTGPDPALVELAQSLDLYDPQGQPDTKRAAKIQARMGIVAKEAAQQAVQPITQQQHYDRSVENYNRALGLQYPDGTKPDAGELANLWRQMPMDYTSDWRIAQTIVDAWYANSLRSGKIKAKAPAPPVPPPPLATEPVGAGGRKPVLMTDFERSIARSRGMNDQTWGDRTKGFTPKATNTLEED